MANQETKFKKGEYLCKEGEVPQSFYLIQSGRVSIFCERGGQRVEIMEAGPGQVVCEQGVFGFPRQNFSCVATSEVKCVELPIDPIKTVFEKSPKPLNLFMKSLGEVIRKEKSLLKSHQSEKDNAPCPPRYIPRLCAILSLVSKNSGTHPKPDKNQPAFKKAEDGEQNPRFKDDDLIVSFNTLKIYTSRMFFESHQRMESFCVLLDKLGYLTCLYEKNEDTEKMELANVRIHDVETIEIFGEFYQHNYFKPGRSEIIHLDKIAYIFARALVEASVDEEVDHRGLVSIDYNQFKEDTLEKFGFDIKETYVALLEKKGLFVKRTPINDKVMVQFDKKEFHEVFAYWQIIHEIDHWNEKGAVLKDQDYNKIVKGGPKTDCPSCKKPVTAEANFCPACGHKLAGSEAA